MIIVFDLDDTLYNEITFVKSGFQAVAEYISNHYEINVNLFYQSLLDNLERFGRGVVFDTTLKEFNIFSKKLVYKCVSIYRLHKPNIKLSYEASLCLERLKPYNKYIVTDGNKIVQQNKVNALQIDKYFKKIYITHRYGLKYAKPSPYCFTLIKREEKIPYESIVYIGDNENKDFVGIKPLGIRTIRIKQGMFKYVNLNKEYKADIEINSLNEITIELLKNLVYGKKNSYR